MILSLQQIAELKNRLNDKFGVYLHVSDSCGGQSFWFDDTVDERVCKEIEEYLGRFGAKAVFGGDRFTVK